MKKNKTFVKVPEMLKLTLNKKWVLPNFQREFVWTAEQIAGLFDSIARGYPVGAIILLKYRADFHFQARSLDGEECVAPKHLFYILDGQQRLTSLFKIIKEYPSRTVAEDLHEVHYLPIIRTQQDHGNQQNYAFFLNYNANLSNDRYVVAKRQSKKTHSIEWMKENDYIPLEYVFCRGQILNSYLAKHKIVSFKGKILKFKNAVLQYKLLINQCDTNWKMDEYRTVFSRLNDAGTRLSAFDECASILNTYKFNLHKKWKSVSSSQKYSAIGKLDIDPIYILKTMFMVDQINRKDLHIHPPSLNNLKKFFKTQKDGREILSTWNYSVEYVNDACKRFIKCYGVIHKRLIPYTPMIVTLASAIYYFKKIPKHARFANKFDKKIDWWYWSSVFSSQYDKGTDIKIASHVKKLIGWVHPTKGKNSRWGHVIDFKYLPGDLKRLHISTDARYRGILCLPLRKRKKDILGNTIEDFEDHHFFPKQRLMKNDEMELDASQINNIANRLAVDLSSNRTIHNIYPFEYKNQKKKIPISKRLWDLYMIPFTVHDIQTISKRTYSNFLKKRRELIINEIKKVVKKPQRL